MEASQITSTGVRRFLRPKILIPLIILLVAAAAFVLYWFEPQALFIDERVDEKAPGESKMMKDESMSKGDAMSKEEEMMKDDNMMSPSGVFRGLDHDTSGKATLLKQDNGSYSVRLEEFRTENGPDLKVYLSSAPASADPSTFDDDYVDLGDLKGNIGNQNYAVPAGTDLSKYKSVVIWCKRFAVGFGVAPLEG